MVVLLVALGVLIFVRHHENIRRILDGSESRIGRK
jgi:glycerol-3-phosphate acyltransferase PlsY